MIKIFKFEIERLVEFEEFRSTAIAEGNNSLLASKLDPLSIQGQLLLCYYENKLISISAIEPSHYTNDADIAARVCRYHVLKKYRNKFLFCGFQMLKHHVEWADVNNFKVIYFTHDVNSTALNALYQKRKKYTLGADNHWFDDPSFTDFKLEKNILFKVSQNSADLQFIYSRKIPSNYNWKPVKSVLVGSDVALEYLK